MVETEYVGGEYFQSMRQSTIIYIMHHRKSKSCKVLPTSKLSLNHALQFRIAANENNKLKHFPKVMKKTGSTAEILNKQFSPIPRITPINKMSPKKEAKEVKKHQLMKTEIYEEFLAQIPSLLAIKHKFMEYNDNLLNKKIIADFKYLTNGKVLVALWDQLFNFVSRKKARAYDMIRQFEVEQEIEIDSDIISGMEMMRNIGKYKVAEYKRANWRKREARIKTQEISLKDSLLGAANNLSKVSNPQVREQIASSLIKIDDSRSSSQKDHYKVYKQKALDLLMSKGNIKCQLLRAEVFMEVLNI